MLIYVVTVHLHGENGERFSPGINLYINEETLLLGLKRIFADFKLKETLIPRFLHHRFIPLTNSKIDFSSPSLENPVYTLDFLRLHQYNSDDEEDYEIRSYSENYYDNIKSYYHLYAMLELEVDEKEIEETKKTENIEEAKGMENTEETKNEDRAVGCFEGIVDCSGTGSFTLPPLPRLPPLPLPPVHPIQESPLTRESRSVWDTNSTESQSRISTSPERNISLGIYLNSVPMKKRRKPGKRTGLIWLRMGLIWY